MDDGFGERLGSHEVSPGEAPGAGSLKRFHQGTHRVRPPADTWDWIKAILPRVGVTRVADVTRLDVLDIPVFQAIRPRSKNLSVSQGKAPTRLGAMVSGAMEAVELWHAESLEHLTIARLPIREMQFGNVIESRSFKWRPDSLLLDALAIEWVEAHSLTHNRTGWLPRAMMELDFTVPRAFRPRMFHLTSNGLASGNCREEALVHSLCELIEREALFRAHTGTLERVPIDLTTIDVDPCKSLIDRFHSAGMKVGVYDITWDLGITSIVVDVVSEDLPNVWRGAGCHPAPDVAISRALTEAAQSRLTYISGARDDLTQFAEGPSTGAFSRFPSLPARRRFDDLSDRASGDVETDLGRILEALDDAQLEPFCLDLYRAEIGVPVVMCFIPGLREAPYG